VNIVRRLGKSPRERGSVSNGSCPDVFELSDGRFAIIGTDMTDVLDGLLPPDASRADYERIVVVTRETLVTAKPDIPSGSETGTSPPRTGSLKRVVSGMKSTIIHVPKLVGVKSSKDSPAKQTIR
jgi:hypothetical protein